MPRPFQSAPVAISVLKRGAFYFPVQNPADEDVAAADVAYLGGRAYEVSAEEAAALVAAGYEVSE